MSEPKISVVMPVYNREEYLKESIESILNQTFTDFEFIIVDDQSTDSSWQIIQEYADKDKRIISIKNTDEKGCWSARNFGWNLAKGKYMAIMDSDDIALPERLQKEFDFMEQHKDVDICGAWMKTFGSDCDRIISTPLHHEEIKDSMFFSNQISQPTVMIRRISFETVHIRYTNNVAEDYELWCRIIDKLKFANISEVLMFYRVHKNQIGIANRTEQNNNAKDITLRNLQNIAITLSEEEEKIYLGIVYGGFLPENKEKLILSVKILDNISISGTAHGYKQYFNDRIRNIIKQIVEYSFQHKATSLKLYFSILIKWKIFETPRANLRYVYYCLRNRLHV